MIVELIGLPGSGKTTVQTGILNSNVYEKYDFRTRDEIVKNSIVYNWKWTLRLMYLDPRMWKLLCWVNKLKKELPFAETRRVWFNRFLVMSWALMRNRKKNLLLDEGVIQYISSILYEERAAECRSIACILDFFTHKMDMGYIHINTEEQICLQRIRERNRSNDRYNKIEDDEELLQMLQFKQKNVQEIANMADVKFRILYDGDVERMELERYLD